MGGGVLWEGEHQLQGAREVRKARKRVIARRSVHRHGCMNRMQRRGKSVKMRGEAEGGIESTVISRQGFPCTFKLTADSLTPNTLNHRTPQSKALSLARKCDCDAWHRM